MTSAEKAITQTRLVRVQEKGQVTLPTALRRKLGLKKGDLVAVMETADGILITPQEVVASRLFDQLGSLLKEKGVSLEDLIESGREVRAELAREKYGGPTESKRGQ
jgi:AbrB family looped-hinge helix DNA binding protein